MPDPLWYKDAIIYELHVRSYFDSVDDGIGDFRGLTQKLDYLEDLGVTAIWILPFYPSPLKDDGYDIADYLSVNPQYGKLEDFKHFLEEAHRHGLRVITELVINHTSDQHPWFQRARRSPAGSAERDFYVWSDTPDKYADATIMFPEFETSNWNWDPVAKQYYWHRFYSHQPDLNYDNPAVWDAIIPVVDFWFKLGVDGMRLDAVPFLYEREGTTCEHLPETHAFLRALRKHVDERFPDRMFLAEANAWPEDMVQYFGSGDECQMVFHFPLMPRLFMSLHQEDRFPIIDIFEQTPAIPESCQWCLFLRNHDELTLAMITDEERDYMYRAYAQDRQAKIFLGIRHRLAPLLKDDRRRIELMNALLFSLPGTPVIYYGDEIGMGDNIYLGDRNGVRTPMQWSGDRNAGFSRANPQKLFLPVIIDPEYHYEATNVEAQQSNPSSLLWWMKRLIALRKRFRAFGRGSIQFLEHTNSRVLAFVRQYENETILVVANLSRFVQHVELNLADFAGWTPEELFGGSVFPALEKGLYRLSLGPHGFYWFGLRHPVPSESHTPSTEYRLPEFHLTVPWTEWIREYGRNDIETILPEYLRRRGVIRHDRATLFTRIHAAIPFTIGEQESLLLIIRAGFRSGLPETVPILLTLFPPEQEDFLLARSEVMGLARVTGRQSGILGAAMGMPKLSNAFLTAILEGRRIAFADGELVAAPVSVAPDEVKRAADLTPMLRQSFRNNLCILYGSEYVLKAFRRVDEGVHPDLEVSRFLYERRRFTRLAPVAGYLELHPERGEPSVLAVLHRYVANQGTAWQLVVNWLSLFFEEIAARPTDQLPAVPPVLPLCGESPAASGDEFPGLAGHVSDLLRLLGQRAAEMHQALASTDDPAFVPTPYSKGYQRSMYQSMRGLAGRLQERLVAERDRFTGATRDLLDRFLAVDDRLMARFDAFRLPVHGGLRTRIHGDYHLGQLLFTGNDFVIIDFEGQPLRSLGERRMKRSPLRDVASMVRSFAYAAASLVHGLAHTSNQPAGLIRDEDRARLKPWAEAWANRAARAFLRGYLTALGDSPLLPAADALPLMLDLFTLEKALSEVDYELTYRPEWVIIPLGDALQYLGVK